MQTDVALTRDREHSAADAGSGLVEYQTPTLTARVLKAREIIWFLHDVIRASFMRAASAADFQATDHDFGSIGIFTSLRVTGMKMRVRIAHLGSFINSIWR